MVEQAVLLNEAFIQCQADYESDADQKWSEYMGILPREGVFRPGQSNAEGGDGNGKRNDAHPVELLELLSQRQVDLFSARRRIVQDQDDKSRKSEDARVEVPNDAPATRVRLGEGTAHQEADDGTKGKYTSDTALGSRTQTTRKDLGCYSEKKRLRRCRNARESVACQCHIDVGGTRDNNASHNSKGT